MEAGFVENAEDWFHSSTADYSGIRKGNIELIYLNELQKRSLDEL